MKIQNKFENELDKTKKAERVKQRSSQNNSFQISDMKAHHFKQSGSKTIFQRHQIIQAT